MAKVAFFYTFKGRGTNNGTKVKKKLRKDVLYFNKPYKPAVLQDRGGDLNKEWYVEFYVWQEGSEKLIRK